MSLYGVGLQPQLWRRQVRVGLLERRRGFVAAFCWCLSLWEFTVKVIWGGVMFIKPT